MVYVLNAEANPGIFPPYFLLFLQVKAVLSLLQEKSLLLGIPGFILLMVVGLPILR